MWTFILMSSGVGYWLHPDSSQELTCGSALLVSKTGSGVVRISQLGPAVLHYFSFDPARLMGLLSWGEQQALERARMEDSVRIFPASAPHAQNFKSICLHSNTGSVSFRLKLLDLILQAIGSKVWEVESAPNEPAGAEIRLQNCLNSKSAKELSELSFNDLLREIGCTPRHLSRIFHKIVGMSFREKQAQVRLVRAQELLATTQTKIVQVALESGFQSLSFFNLIFKRRFGLTPAKWRDQTRRYHTRFSQTRRSRQRSLPAHSR